MTKTTLVQIIGGSITRREPARPGAQGHPAKRFFARHDRGRPQFNPITHTCRAVESLAEHDEDVRYDIAPKPLDEVRAWATDILNSTASERLSSLRTPGMDSVYASQAREALDFMALTNSGQPTPPETFPVLSALIGTVAPTLRGVVDIVMSNVAAESVRMSAINARRLSAKAAVAQAQSVEQIASIVESARAAIEAA